MPLSPLAFFSWKTKRYIVDIRHAVDFSKGSFPGAISAPADQFDSIPGLLVHLKEHYPSAPIHLIDTDGSIATAITSHDIDCLEGGYNAFQYWRDNIYTEGPVIAVVSGKSGCRKTEFLRALAEKGRQVMDLELLTNHRGSVFGAFATDQPAVEQFQFEVLRSWLSFNPDLPVWIEDKGPVLGKLRVPEKLYRKMISANVFELDTPFGSRLQHIREEYAGMDRKIFADHIKKLEKRMGFSANHKALHFHETGQTDKCLRLLLDYYDRAYDHLKKSTTVKTKHTITFSACTDEESIQRLEAMIMSL
jgi:tRNA 2-selenouridine synthase